MRLRSSVVVLAGLTGALVMGVAAPASAHPLGNFTVNHYDGLTLHQDRVDDLLVIDAAEIPTFQARPSVDANHDGTVSLAELATYASQTCARAATGVTVAVDGAALRWSVGSSAFGYRPGASGLDTSRLTCRLSAPADLSRARRVQVTDGYLSDRIGWREMTAVGVGVHLAGSSVPAASVSDELTHYPDDLLGSPLDVRAADIKSLPGAGLSRSASRPAVVSAGPATRLVSSLTGAFNRLVGRRHLTAAVGLAALGMSLLLGAAHAALPGHGKTVMAAYLAGRRGSARDAALVGATVTATHTAGVLVLGLLLSASASVAGDSLIRDLGVVSGLLVVAVGVSLLRSALRGLQRGGHAHDHDHHHDHDHPHSHEHGHDHERFSRRGLVGLGVAGGLVPSPSALVVLLGAIALGRTWFGVLLVLGYGLGMALTLTAAGLLLVRVRDRLDRPATRRKTAFVDQLARVTPLATSVLVVLVGMGLAARGLAPTL